MDTDLKMLARHLLPGLLAAGTLVAAPARAGAAAAVENAIRGIDVAERGGAVEVDIQGTRAPSYTVFKLRDPPRLVVDIAGGDVSAVASPMPVAKGGVLSVSTAQYKDEKSAVGRVILALEAAARYEVTPRGESVVVRVHQGDADASPPPAPTATATPTQTATATSTPTQNATPTQNPTPAATATPVSTASAAAPTADNVVSRRMDEAAVKHRATALTGAHMQKGAVVLSANGQIAKFEVIELKNPPRLAIDLYGVEKAPRAAAAAGAGFKQVRFGRDQGKVRVVLDAEGELPAYQVRRIQSGLAVTAGASAAASKAPTPTPTSTAAPTPTAPLTRAPTSIAPKVPAPTQLQDLRVKHSGSATRIEISGKAAHSVSRPDSRTLVLTLEGARLPKRLERSLDTAALSGPVSMVSAFNQPSTGQVRVVVSLRGEASDQLAETPAGLSWTVGPGAGEQRAPEGAVVLAEAQASSSSAQAAGFSAAAPSYALSGAPQRREYTGRRITLDFHDIEIRNLLRLIAEVSKKNVVVADDVTGKVTVSLRNVPWDQALDIVLKAKGLDKEEMGNVIRVAKVEQIAKEAQARADAAKAGAPLIPLKVRLIPVNFATAGDVQKQVKDVLSDRGSVTIDERTNVIIVKDTQEALARAEGLVRNLDTETPQVLIESRIVEAASNFQQALGVQWGGNATFSNATGNPLGVVFPNIASAAGGTDQTGTQGTSTRPNYAVNLPAPVGQGSGGAIGFTFGTASGAFNLNLRLTALENSGVVKTISAPKIATIDNKEATIGQGISIPFSQVSASGVNTTFIEAKLELKVTPHVTADGSILMKIKATNNQPNPQLTGANGQPSISKREAETSVMVKDGDTTVIGGIYTRQTASRRSEVPFFGKIPVLGFFFRNTSEQDDHTELLIFITPRILNRQPAVAAGS
jgi:type IV pilus assembly protein PilQ